MRRHAILFFCATGLFVSLVARPVHADAIHFNTDTGVMTINGNPASTFFGTAMQTSVVGGVQQFRFLGDLNFIASDVVTASGARPLSLWAGDNVSVASGAVFNFDASGQTAKLGGGNGGGAVSGGASAGVPGIGGFGFLVLGGAGGAGGVIGGSQIVNPGSAGGTGATAVFGTPGTAGSAGQAGAVGQAGFQNISIAAAGAAGTAGSLGATILSQEEGGFGGAGGFPEVLGVDGEPGEDATVPGSNGRNGGAGGNGGNGGAGLNNLEDSFTLSGGAGGGSGGSGGGGGGGGGGSSGRGGGGGGGGSSGTVPITIIFENGADGGPGGFGGQGGVGGSGSQGVGSGRGGAGAGAIEIAAQGRIAFDGTINIRGAAGIAGSTSSNPESGAAGGAGTPGFAGDTTLLGVGGNGGPGGAGSAGGNGGNGGRGGNGGHGGGGAGGTVMFKSSLFSAAGGTINAGGGGSIGNPGGNGRYLVSDNGAALPDYGTRNGVSENFQIGLAARDVNQLIQGSPSTPNITQLIGGADIYGLVNVNFSGVPEFLELQENAPVGATAALVRRSIGFLGDQYIGHDMLMLVNLTTSALASPSLGIGPTGAGYQSSLPERGFARNTAFGGSGPVTLTSLPAESVYATLVPNDLTDYEVFGYAGFGETVSWDTLDVAYLAPPIFSLGDFDLDGDVDGRDFLMWQRGESPIQLGTGDLADWQANYGFSSLTAASTAVPEPGTLMLVFGVIALSARPRR